MKTSYRVIELVRSKISNEHLTASDTDISRVLGLSRAMVSAYKYDQSVMSVETLAKAQELLQLPSGDYFDLVLQLTAEGAHTPETQELWGRLHRMVRSSLKNSGRIAGSLVLAIVAIGMSLALPAKQASAAEFSPAKNIHYAKYDICEAQLQADPNWVCNPIRHTHYQANGLSPSSS